MSKTKLTPLSEEHLDMVLEWRNKPEVRANMYTDHIISKDEHYQWFEHIKSEKTKRYFVFYIEQQPCGVIGFTEINQNAGTASWAFYSGDTSIRGVGSKMEVSALNYAFNSLGLNKLYCEVLEFNDKVITFHKKHGFSVEGIFKNQHFSKGRLWDIYRLAIFKKDWNRLSIELPLMRDNKFGPGKTFTHQFSISKEQVLMFSEASSDTNKLHIDDAYSREYGFDKSLVHGFLSGSVFSKIFGTLFPGEGTIYKSQSLEFKSPIYPNTELNAKIHIETKIGNRLKVRTLVLDKDDNPAITGYAEIILPLETA